MGTRPAVSSQNSLIWPERTIDRSLMTFHGGPVFVVVHPCFICSDRSIEALKHYAMIRPLSTIKPSLGRSRLIPLLTCTEVITQALAA